MLTLPEELLVLRKAPAGSEVTRRMRALDAATNPLAKPLAAARLIELVLAGRVTVESRRRHLVRSDVIVVLEARPTGDALLDDVLERLAASEVRSCKSWIKRTAAGSEDAYRTRLVAKSLIRSDVRTGDAAAATADEACVAAVRDRIRSVLERPEAADVREVALVTLLAHTGSVFTTLDEPSLESSGVWQLSKDSRRVDGLGRQAINSYKRSRESQAEPDDDQPLSATEVADAIERIATAAAPDPGA